MAMKGRKGSWRVAVCVILCFTCAAIACLALNAFLAKPSAPLRIGLDHNPPYCDLKKTPYEGLLIDAIGQAAARRGIPIQWVPMPNVLPNDALEQKLVDVWPMLGINEYRQARFHLTKPWLQNSFCLVSQADKDLTTIRKVAGRSVAHGAFPLATKLARQFLPGARLEGLSTNRAVVEAVCSGKVDAGFLESPSLDVMLLRRHSNWEFVWQVVSR